MANRIVTVFGGTGFLGRRLVRHLTRQGFSARIARDIPRALEYVRIFATKARLMRRSPAPMAW